MLLTATFALYSMSGALPCRTWRLGHTFLLLACKLMHLGIVEMGQDRVARRKVCGAVATASHGSGQDNGNLAAELGIEGGALSTC